MSDGARTGDVTGVDWGGAAYLTISGEDRITWAELRVEAAGARVATARRFWGRVLAQAVELAWRNGKARVAARNLGGPDSDLDALTWAAVAENMAGERPPDLKAPAELFARCGRAEAFARAAKLREALVQLGYAVGE